jgi:hypothetical protein
MRNVRRTPAFRQAVPQEAGVGWPLPSRRDGKAYLTLPFFGMPPRADAGSIPLFAPFAAMTLEWRTGTLVAYRDLRYERLWEPIEDPVGTFPHEAVARLRRSEYLERRGQLLAMYDELLDTLAAGGSFDAAWSARFSELLRTLMEPALVPYYGALAPKFIDRWLPA